MPRYYQRQLRASLADRNGASGAFVVEYPDVYAPPAIVTLPGPAFAPAALDDETDDSEDILSPIDSDADAEATEATGSGRRRRRRGRRGQGRQNANGVTPAEMAPAALAPENGVASQPFIEDLPPSSHLAAMVQSGSLVLPEPRGRRRRRFGDRDSRESRDLGGVAPSVGSALPDLGDRSGQRPTVVESLLRQQFVRLDQLVQKQDRLLSTMEQMLALMQRRGGLGGGGGTMAPPQKVAVFVDVPNIVYAADRIAARIDWGKVLNFLTRDRQLVRATAYSPVTDDPRQRVDLQRFVQPFHDLPFRILTKPLKRFGNGEIKANFDVELAIDVVTMADRLDVVSLVSGDGDFRRMVEIVQAKGVRVEVMAFSSSTASELRQVCDTYIDFNQHLHELTIEG